MKNSTAGTILYNHYADELNSFIKHLEKVKQHPDESSIHKLRVNIKNIRAVFQLLEMLFRDKFTAKEYFQELKPVFKNAGIIREKQVNIISLSHYKILPSLAKQFQKFEMENKYKYLLELNNSLCNFDIHLLRHSEKKIRKLCRNIDSTLVSKVCQHFITAKLKQIKELISAGNNDAIIHKIRMMFKALNPVINLYYKLNPEINVKRLLSISKRNGTLIGNWHDRTMLVYSLEHFLIKNNNLKGINFKNVVSLLNKIKRDNRPFFKTIKKKIKPIFS